MAKSLVIVESPAKAKTIEKILGKGYKVLASYGHVRALPSKLESHAESASSCSASCSRAKSMSSSRRFSRTGGDRVSVIAVRVLSVPVLADANGHLKRLRKSDSPPSRDHSGMYGAGRGRPTRCRQRDRLR